MGINIYEIPSCNQLLDYIMYTDDVLFYCYLHPLREAITGQPKHKVTSLMNIGVFLVRFGSSELPYFRIQ